MSTVCCLTMPANHYSLTSPSLLSKTINNREEVQQEEEEEEEEEEAENYSIIINENLSSMTHPNNLPMCSRFCQQQQTPLLLVAEEAEPLGIDNDKLLLPRSTRSLKRRTSLFEKSRDWARRLITLHRNRRNTILNGKTPDVCCELTNLRNQPKRFDEDGYLSPMEIKAKLDNIAREKHSYYHPSLSKLSTNPPQQLLVYSHSSSDISQQIYRCHGPIIQPSTTQCTCQQQLSTPSFVSEFHKSLSIVDYIDFDVSEDVSSSSTKQTEEDPLECLKYLFDDYDKQQSGTFLRRTPRRATNTSSISADSGYCDMPISTSKFIPVHLISCTLIPVNVTRTESMDIPCLTCTCPSSSSSTSTSAYFTTKTERRRRKSSAHSSRSHPHGTYSRQHMDIIENEINNHCSCNNKYYSTMTICPTLSLSSPMGTKSVTKIDVYSKDDGSNKQQQKRHLRKKRISFQKSSTTTDDLTSIARWYKPNLSRDTICYILQQANYGAFMLRKSTTHPDCYALSVKVPKFSHESNIAHYLIEKLITNNNTSSYRIKGTIKQFPTLLSLLTHHSVMPEILPITLNLNEILAV